MQLGDLQITLPSRTFRQKNHICHIHSYKKILALKRVVFKKNWAKFELDSIAGRPLNSSPNFWIRLSICFLPMICKKSVLKGIRKMHFSVKIWIRVRQTAAPGLPTRNFWSVTKSSLWSPEWRVYRQTGNPVERRDFLNFPLNFPLPRSPSCMPCSLSLLLSESDRYFENIAFASLKSPK